MKKNKTVVLGVTGGIAVYKSLDIISKLKKKNIDVHVIMTNSATEFVSELSFQSLSQNPVIVGMFEEPKSWEIQHISLAERADVFVVAPATANIIGKIANGIADDMLSTTILATKAPILIAPAMNTNMYENTIVQRNISSLKSMGYVFVEPDEGRLACGSTGKGKLADTDKIVDYIEMMLHNPKDLKGKRVLVTAGPTREDIDPVRFISNRSTGKMGYSIARAARNRGAEVILISGRTNLRPPEGVKLINVYSAEDMYNAVREHFDDVDIVIKSAAVGDYKPKTKSNIKMKKSDSDMQIELTRNKDILYEVGKMKKNQIIVGFAAETNELLENAKIKIEKKNLDLIVANDVTMEKAGFGVDTNTVNIIKENGETISLPNMLKEEVAHKILDVLLEIKR
jgi:phosphopantothenoylcysteine decarboxylase / phosphopantothenate---cysteine ligase